MYSKQDCLRIESKTTKYTDKTGQVCMWEDITKHISKHRSRQTENIDCESWTKPCFQVLLGNLVKICRHGLALRKDRHKTVHTKNGEQLYFKTVFV